MNKTKAILTLLVLFSLAANAQDQAETVFIRPIQFFIGIQPSVEIEPFDEFRNSFDVNIIPVQLEYAVNNKLSIRISPQAFLQFKPEFPRELARVGAGLTVPYHFARKNSEEGHRGFYAGPFAGVNIHKLDNYISVIAAAEVGYYFLFNSIFSFNVGVQAGRKIQMDPNGGYSLLSNHTGAIFAFGLWF